MNRCVGDGRQMAADKIKWEKEGGRGGITWP